MTTTSIISNGAVFLAGKKIPGRDRFNVFDRALSFGMTLPDGTIADANYVWLSDWQLENINNKFLVPIDLESYRELKNHIAKALVPLLQIWLFASHKAEAFEKRYNELCEILTLQVYPTPSQILRQFKPSLDELAHHGYIKSWEIAKTSDKTTYKMIFFHGPKFYGDRRRRLEQKKQAEPILVIAKFDDTAESSTKSEQAAPTAPAIVPRKGESSATQTDMSNVPGHLVDELSARGLMPAAVLNLLGSLSPDRLETIAGYIEYWDNARKTGDVGPGFLYELIKRGDPLPAGFETSRQRAARIAVEEQRKHLARVEDLVKANYEKYTQKIVNDFIAALPPGDFESRVATKKAETATQSEFWSDRPDVAEQFATHAVRAEISKQIILPEYESFHRQEFARVSAEIGTVRGRISEPSGVSKNANISTIDESVQPDGVFAPDHGPSQGHDMVA